MALEMSVANPLDPNAYTSPASILSMIRLRQFLLDYFTGRVFLHSDEANTSSITDHNDNTNGSERNLLPVSLITHSPNFFARARAVIPALTDDCDKISFADNPRDQGLLEVTEQLRSRKLRRAS